MRCLKRVIERHYRTEFSAIQKMAQSMGNRDE